MTITTQESFTQYTADGVQTDFTFNWQIIDATDVAVYVDNVIVPASEYVLTVNQDKIGGTVAFNTAPADQSRVLINREVPSTQETDYPPYGPFPAESHEAALDKLTMLVQQTEATVTLSVNNELRYVGDWAADTSYKTLNIVTYERSYYLANNDFTSGATFDQNNWTLFLDLDEFWQASDQAAQDALQAAISEANSAVNAQNSANCAAASFDSAIAGQGYATASENWAQYPEDQVVPEGDGTEYSAFHWAQKAQQIVGGGLTDINAVLPITVDKTDPFIPIIGFDGSGLDISDVYLGHGLAYQLGSAANPDNLRSTGLYTWTDLPPVGGYQPNGVLLVSEHADGKVSQVAWYPDQARSFTRFWTGTVWVAWSEIGPDPYVNEFYSYNAAGVTQINVDAGIHDTIYIYGFDSNTQLNIQNLTNGRTVALALDTVGTYTITTDITLLWPDGNQPQYSETGINVVTITNFGGSRYIANLSANHR